MWVFRTRLDFFNDWSSLFQVFLCRHASWPWQGECRRTPFSKYLHEYNFTFYFANLSANRVVLIKPDVIDLFFFFFVIRMKNTIRASEQLWPEWRPVARRSSSWTSEQGQACCPWWLWLRGQTSATLWRYRWRSAESRLDTETHPHVHVTIVSFLNPNFTWNQQRCRRASFSEWEFKPEWVNNEIFSILWQKPSIAPRSQLSDNNFCLFNKCYIKSNRNESKFFCRLNTVDDLWVGWFALKNCPVRKCSRSKTLFLFWLVL